MRSDFELDVGAVIITQTVNDAPECFGTIRPWNSTFGRHRPPDETYNWSISYPFQCGPIRWDDVDLNLDQVERFRWKWMSALSGQSIRNWGWGPCG